MARRECCIPGVVLSLVAAVLLVLSTVSLPLSWSATTPFSVVNGEGVLSLLPAVQRRAQQLC